MIDSKFKWQESDISKDNDDEIKEIAQNLNVSDLVVSILYHRGLKTATEIDSFLNPNPGEINDPFLLNDMELTIDRINDALLNEEKITIYGDYDTDGITSTALMYETLMTLDADVNYYIPDRFKDGYGPNKDVYRQLINNGTDLIITVDNGVGGHQAIDYANERGIDVIITDHHELPEELPNAFAIVHPQHPNGAYPFKELSGVGVAFKVATALLEEVPQEMMDLVALGEIADLVSLTGENRILVTYGLKMLAQTNRFGLKALMDIADFNVNEITSEKVAFGLTPRLNAIGRLQSASLGVELLTTRDKNKAQELAKQIDNLNLKRKEIVNDILTQTKRQLNNVDLSKQKTVVLAGENWHEGVLGIVASQIVELTQRPTIILRQKDGVLKGSARSVEGFNLYEALSKHTELFTSFGGHAAAAGLSLGVENLENLRQSFEAEADIQNLNLDSKTKIKIAQKLTVNQINTKLYEDVEKLEPFGNGNEKPYFEITAEISEIKKIGADKQHLKFNLIENDKKLPVLAFGKGNLGNGLLLENTNSSIVASMSTNTWNNQTTIQLMLKDILQNKIAIIDKRTNKLRADMFKNKAQYIFFSEKMYQQLIGYLSVDSIGVNLSKERMPKNDLPIVLVDLPKSIEELKILKEYDFKEIRVIFYTSKHLYLEKMPTKEEFRKVYKYFIGYPNVLIRKDLEKLSKILHLTKNQLTLIISVFFELGFVKIESGVLNPVSNPVHADLTSAPSYKAWLTKQAIEKTLIYSKTSELVSTLESLILKDN